MSVPPFHGDAAGRRLSVLYIVPPSRQFAGIERVVHDLANHQVRHDAAQPTVCTFSRYDYGAEPIHYRHLQLKAQRLRDVPRQVRAILKCESFDWIVVPQFELATLIWLAAPAPARRRIIVHLHGNPDIERAASLRASVLYRLFTRIVSREIPAILCVSEGLASHMRSLLPHSKCLFSPNPVRMAPGWAEKEETSTTTFKYVSIGRFAPQKGHDLLLAAFSRLLQTHPASELHLIGSGPSEKSLRDLVVMLGIGDRVHFHGYLADPLPVAGQCDVFVLASRWEGFGNVVVEALSAGLGVVVTRCDFGPAEIVREPDVGLVAQPGDVDSLLECLVQARSLPQSAAARQRRRARAIEFSIDRSGRRHTQLLRDLSLACEPLATRGTT